MTGWTVLAWGAACLAGMLLFLRIVACEVERAAQQIKRMKMLKARARTKEEELDAVEVIDAEAA